MKQKHFDMKIESGNGDFQFTGIGCKVVDKSLRTKVGLGPVKETIICKKAKIEAIEKKE